MTAFDFMAGDSDYRAAADAEQHALTARLYQAMAGAHKDLFERFDRMANDTTKTQFTRDEIRAELVAHLKEWKS